MAVRVWARVSQQRTRVLLLGLCALLAGCGGATAKPNIGKTHTPTATDTNLSRKGGVPGATATPALPYRFPKQWQIGFAPSTVVYSFAFMPTNPLVGFVCAPSSAAPAAVQFFATRDGGATWSPLPTAPASNPAILVAGCQIFPDQTNADDIFVAAQDASDSQDTHGVGRLYRSQDGGATWTKLALVLPGTWYGPNTLAVAGSRILVTVAPGGEQNPLPSYLYASDDGGQTWKTIAPTVNGQAQSVNAEMSAMGGMIYVSSAGPAPSGNRAARASALHDQSLGMPRSSGPTIQTTYWKTSNGGATWTQAQLPGALPIFVRSADETSYYGLSLNRPSDGNGGYLNGTTTLYASVDGGATWTALPTFAGVENGYLDPTLLGVNGGLALAPNGEVVAAAQHPTATVGGDAGMFALHVGDPSPTWQPLAWDMGAQRLQAVVQNGQIRVWGLLYNGSENGALATITLS